MCSTIASSPHGALRITVSPTDRELRHQRCGSVMSRSRGRASALRPSATTHEPVSLALGEQTVRGAGRHARGAGEIGDGQLGRLLAEPRQQHDRSHGRTGGH